MMLLCRIQAHHLRQVLAHHPMARLLLLDQRHQHHRRHEREGRLLQTQRPRGDISQDMPRAGLLQDLFRTGLFLIVWSPNHQMKKISHAFRGITTLWQISGHFCSCNTSIGALRETNLLSILQTAVVYSN